MKDMTNIITVLINKYGLGELESDILPVSGGLMHRMFKVKTSTGEYAVKCLNPEIMNRPNVFENYAKAEKLERVLEERGLPIVPALEFGGKIMLEADGRYFYVFRWQEGKTYVIDLECLDYGNQVASSLNLALQWSGTVNGRFSKENPEAFYRGYLGAYDNGFHSYGKIFGIAYTWVEWLEYNIRRALKMEGEIQTVLMGVSSKG